MHAVKPPYNTFLLFHYVGVSQYKCITPYCVSLIYFALYWRHMWYESCINT